MRMIASVPTLAACCVCAGFASAETVAVWSFDDGTPPGAASALVTAVNAPALDATAAGNGGGSAPTFNADVPGSVIYSRSGGAPLNSANSASLRFVNAGLPGNTYSHDGGCVTAPDNDPLLRATNLTVEAFVKVDRNVGYPLIVGKARPSEGVIGSTSWNIDMNDNGYPRIRIDNASGFNQNWGASVSIEDGKWHHVAFTFTAADNSVRLYVDYVLSGSGNAGSGLVYEAGELRIGEGAGGQAFDGWIDEVRISDKVLQPYQFMTLSAPTPTVGYWPFDDGAADTAAGTLVNTFYAPVLNGTAVAGGSGSPTFSSERPPATTARISDGYKGPEINVNSGSLFFSSGSYVSVPGIEVTNFTAEAFVKVNQHGYEWPQLIGKARDLTGGLSWSLAINCDGYLRARFDTQTPPSNDGVNTCFESSAAMVDGQWHHVALTYSDATHTVKLYKDYVKVLENATWASLKFDDGVYKIGAGDGNFNGWIDEVRLTASVLEPVAFLHTMPIAGTTIAVH